MRECLRALVEVKRELSGVGPGRTEIITVCPFRAHAVRLCVPTVEKSIIIDPAPEAVKSGFENLRISQSLSP